MAVRAPCCGCYDQGIVTAAAGFSLVNKMEKYKYTPKKIPHLKGMYRGKKNLWSQHAGFRWVVLQL